jgi:hypothetical protein
MSTDVSKKIFASIFRFDEKDENKKSTLNQVAKKAMWVPEVLKQSVQRTEVTSVGPNFWAPKMADRHF